MSFSDSDPQLAELVQYEIIVANYSHIAVTALFFYEYLITFTREVNQIWYPCHRRKVTGSTVLFFVNRYSAFMQRVLGILVILPWPGLNSNVCLTIRFNSVECFGGLTVIFSSCKIIEWTSNTLLEISYIIIAVFFALRVYAITMADWRPAVIVLILGLVLPSAVMYQQSVTTYFVLPPGSLLKGSVRSTFHQPAPADSKSIVGIISRSILILADLFVIVITLFKTFNVKMHASRAGVSAPLISLLVRDGSLYFLAIMFMNLLDIVLLRTIGYGAIADMITTISSILISRFILNLREIDLHDGFNANSINRSSGAYANDDLRAAEFSSIHFAYSNQLVGNMGASLNAGEDESQDEEPKADEDVRGSESYREYSTNSQVTAERPPSAPPRRAGEYVVGLESVLEVDETEASEIPV
ncbi:hypothetical protein K474DRAFT_1742944 [Panus rudis PR-1116 ss-1]|nr:hypothetical protein K474DRAFT_1742944 [Panus rudis PR-1116 ss-1]